MKFFNKSYLYFILIFLVTALFDYIFFVGLFSQVFPHPPENFLIGITLMIVFFIIIPAAIAYHLTFKLKKYSPQGLEIKQMNNKIVIGITILLTAVLILVFKTMLTPKFESYTFYPVTDQEFVAPIKIVVTKKIRGEEYYLGATDKGILSVYQKINNNRDDDRYFFDIPFDPKLVIDFWYDYSSGTVFVIEYTTAPFSKGRVEQIYQFSLGPAIKEPIKLLKTSIVYKGDKILDYYSTTGTLLMQSLGTDGYWNRGEIWTLTGSESRILQKFGPADYALHKNLRFLGYDGKWLYFVLFNYVQNPDHNVLTHEGDLGLEEIYKLDPQTSIKQTISGIDFPDNVTAAWLSKDSKNIIMTTDNKKNYILDLEGNSLIQEATQSASN